MKKNAKGQTIYSEPVRFGHPVVAHGKVYVWIPRRALKPRYRKEKIIWVNMPVVIVAFINRWGEPVDMHHQSLH